MTNPERGTICSVSDLTSGIDILLPTPSTVSGGVGSPFLNECFLNYIVETEGYKRVNTCCFRSSS